METRRWGAVGGLEPARDGVWAPDGEAAAELWAVRPDGTDARRLAPLGVPDGFTGFGHHGALDWHARLAVAPT